MTIGTSSRAAPPCSLRRALIDANSSRCCASIVSTPTDNRSVHSNTSAPVSRIVHSWNGNIIRE
jgi:hypothetical protein